MAAADSSLSANGSPAPSKRDSSFLNLTSISGQSSNPGNEPGTPHKSRSILNLTSSALYGIYAPTSYSNNAEDSRRPSSTSLFDQNEPLAISTPWGNGAQTPAIRDSGHEPPYSTHTSKSNGVSAEHLAASLNGHGSSRRLAASSVGRRAARPSYNAFGAAVRILLLAGLGVAYGTLITHLHDTRGLAPVRVGIERRSPLYLGFWGSIAVVLGILLPVADTFWSRRQQQYITHQTTAVRQKTGAREKYTAVEPAAGASAQREREANLLGADWNPLVRSVGAFVGIAFAIRKLPWQSPQQLSLTLALVNPCIWYLVDRTRTGFYLAAVTGITGSLLVLSLLPGVVPSPSLSVAANVAIASARASPTATGSFWAGAANALQAGTAIWRPAAAAVSSASSSAASAAPTGVAAKAVEWAVEHGPGQLAQLLSLEGVGVATWTSSVLFCSSVFFGNVGRRLWG